MSAGLDTLVAPLLVSNLRAALLIVLVYFALKVLRPRAGAVRHAAWLTAIVACLALPFLSSVVPDVSIPLLPANVADRSPGLAAVAVADAVGTMLRPRAVTAVRWLLIAYVLVAAALLGRFLVLSVWRIGRLKREISPWTGAEANALRDALCERLSIRRRVELLLSEDDVSPVTWGAIRPRVVLPIAARDWSIDRMRNVLAHELCHVSRFDWLRLCLQHVVAAVYWFNPFVWLALRECAFEAERACDDFVLQAGGRPSDYAGQLVDLMASCRGSRPAGVALGAGNFKKRIRAILSSSTEARTMSRLKTDLVTAGIVLSTVALAACEVTRGQPIEDEPAQSLETQSLQEQTRLEAAARQEQSRLEEQERQQAIERAEAEAQHQRNEQAASQATDEQVARARVLEQQARQEAEARQQEARRAYASQLDLQQNYVAQISRALGENEASLRETQTKLQAQRETIEALQAALDQKSVALQETERALAELELKLDTLNVP